MHPLKKAATAAAAAATLLTTTPPASAATHQPDFWSGTCNSGRACLFVSPTFPAVWNADRCFDNFLTPQSFYYARAAGNPFTVYYQDGRSDYVNANSARLLDPNNRVSKVVVWC
jgi:hypothetical protein